MEGNSPSTHHYEGGCSCGGWTVGLELQQPLESLTPRRCSCEFCQQHPSVIVSAPELRAKFSGGTARTRTNGERLAVFYYCGECDELLAVGASIQGVLRGAVNSALLPASHALGEPMLVRPQGLDAEAKVERWGRLWGMLTGLR